MHTTTEDHVQDEYRFPNRASAIAEALLYLVSIGKQYELLLKCNFYGMLFYRREYEEKS